MKKIKLIIPIIALTLFSCSDYLDVNSSPNNPVGSQVTPNLALAAAQTNTYRTLARTGNIFGNLMLNNWGYNVNAFAVTTPEEFTLTFTNTTYAGLWDGFFTASANFTNIINHPSTNYDNHKAIAKICKSFYFQYLVDMYGDIPYSEAHLGSANLTPSYDDDKAIYRDLVVQIDEAIAMIQNPVTGTLAVGAEDAIMGGDMSRWVKFGNTLKLRLLLRQSELTDAETVSYLATEFATLAGASFIDRDATINPGYSNTRDDRQNPYYNMFFELNGTDDKALFRQYRAAEYFALELEALPKDPRRTKLFNVVSGSVVGVRQGDASVVGGGTAPAVISSIGAGLIRSSSQDGYMMTLAEGLLLRAEAVHRGYLTGDAQALFDQAIVASMAQLGSTVGNYIVEINGIPGRGYAAGTTSDEKLEAIMYQKKVAVAGTNALEVYIEYTRTGFIDDIPLVPIATQPNRPRRLLYPNSEYVGNGANVPQQTVNDIFTTGAFWWVP